MIDLCDIRKIGGVFGEFQWVYFSGNDKLHYLLSQGVYELSMDMEDFDNQTRYVKYTSFNVGDETTKYIANISGYSGDVGKIIFLVYSNAYQSFLKYC